MILFTGEGCAWPGGGWGHAWLGVCVAGGMAGGMHGRECASQGVCGRGACMAGRVYVAGGMHGRWVHGRGHAWQGVYVSGGVHSRRHAWQGACVAGGMHGRGCASQGGMHGRGHVWQGACMAGGMHERAVCVVGVVGEMAIAVGSIHPTGMHSC